MKRVALAAASIVVLVLFVSAPAALAQMGGAGGMGSGMGMGMPMGIVVADDGTILTVDRGDGSEESHSAAVVAIGSDGQIKWRAAFDEALPMMLETSGDLVVVIAGDGDMMDDDDQGGGMGGGMGGDEDSDHSFRLAGLALGDGSPRWSTNLERLMPMAMTFSPDGRRLYVEAVEIGDGDDHHGEGEGGDPMGKAILLAFDRDGHLLWSIDLGSTPSVVASRRLAVSYIK